MPDASAPVRTSARPIRLLIVEDHPAIAEGLAALLGAPDDVEVVGVAADADAADRLLETDPPTVVLCDIMLRGRDRGFGLLDRHRERTRFVMFSAFDFPAHHARAIESGAMGFLSKLAPADDLLHAVRRAADGRTTFPPPILASARSAPRRPTARDLALLAEVARGGTNEELAERFGVRVKSIEGALRRMFDRYVVENRTQLVALASRQGWLTDIDRPPAATTEP